MLILISLPSSFFFWEMSIKVQKSKAQEYTRVEQEKTEEIEINKG